MLILLHVVVAILSVVFSTYLSFYPSRFKLYVAYGLVALTLGSGTYLVMSTHAALLQACTLGLLYLGIVSVGVVFARAKLAHVNDE
jgi:hypothetical protein